MINITVKDIQKLELKPTDVLVCKFPEGEQLSRKTIGESRNGLKTIFKNAAGFVPGIIFVEHGLEIKTMSQEELLLMKKLVDSLIK